MRALRVIWVGRTMRGFAQDAVTHYLKRIKPLGDLECIEVRAAGHSGREPAAAAKTESEAILKRLVPGDPMLLLDEKGRELTSREFARELAALSQEKARCVTIVVGGAYGVDKRVKARANGILSLSRMTLPHQLARIVLLEQIYRAMTLQSGQPYHHD